MTGLLILPDFVGEIEEAILLDRIGAIPGARGRRFKRYGKTVYRDHHVLGELPPAWLVELGARLPMKPPDEFTLNEWPAGAGLPHHVDLGGPVICILSLLGNGVLQFTSPTRPHVTVAAPRRGLMRMAGESRDTFTHAVMPSSNSRISLVFRTLT
jgi:hypothetical protein